MGSVRIEDVGRSFVAGESALTAANLQHHDGSLWSYQAKIARRVLGVGDRKAILIVADIPKNPRTGKPSITTGAHVRGIRSTCDWADMPWFAVADVDASFAAEWERRFLALDRIGREIRQASCRHVGQLDWQRRYMLADLNRFAEFFGLETVPTDAEPADA